VPEVARSGLSGGARRRRQDHDRAEGCYGLDQTAFAAILATRGASMGKNPALPSLTPRFHVLAPSLAMQLAYGFQLGGLRTGSPSSPPPHSIRLTGRLLLRSPRLLGPGPRGQITCPDQAAVACYVVI